MPANDFAQVSLDMRRVFQTKFDKSSWFGDTVSTSYCQDNLKSYLLYIQFYGHCKFPLQNTAAKYLDEFVYVGFPSHWKFETCFQYTTV